MKKKEFMQAVKEFKLLTVGAACYDIPGTDATHCANNLTQEQAKQFGEQHHLKLRNWTQGKSCAEVNCN